MRSLATIPLLFLITLLAFGCAMGKKEWPNPQASEDAFGLKLIVGDRQDNCLLLEVAVTGAIERLYRASVQYEIVGDGEGEGCTGCPFVPRDAKHFTRSQADFVLEGRNLKLSLCGLEADKEYRFRVAGKSELSSSPLVYTDIYVTTP